MSIGQGQGITQTQQGSTGGVTYKGTLNASLAFILQILTMVTIMLFL